MLFRHQFAALVDLLGEMGERLEKAPLRDAA